jgi:ubiquinone/menaquinone biosynthesis C-methylase UbiE
MSLEVLATSVDNLRARAEIRRRGLDFVTPRLARLLRKAHLISGVNVGLLQKSWDVLRTLQFMEQHVSKTASILDLGAYGSEVLCSLDRMGFSDLAGIDLNPTLTRMPHKQNIKYVTGDFTQTEFPSETFGAVTAISVLEHGFSGPRVFREISRILKTGGYFIGSTDYWPEKIDTSGVMVYGLDWTIFSKRELLNLIEEAGRYGLVPVGQLNFEASEPTVSWFKREYTFAWFVFQKVGVRSEPTDTESVL